MSKLGSKEGKDAATFSQRNGGTASVVYCTNLALCICGNILQVIVLQQHMIMIRDSW